MRYIVKLCFIVVCTLFYGCGSLDWGIPVLYIQKIEGTSKLLCHYDAWGGRDSHVSGFTILDSNEIFDVLVAEANKLPLLYLQEIPNKNGISGVIFDNPEEGTNNNAPVFTPISVNQENNNGINITVKKYQYTGFAKRSGGLGRYEFKSFKETRDSLFFYDLDDNESMVYEHLGSLKFKKTNVFVSQLESGMITKVEMDDLILSKVKGEILSNKMYVLKPKPGVTININDFSDYGVFKEKFILKD